MKIFLIVNSPSDYMYFSGITEPRKKQNCTIRLTELNRTHYFSDSGVGAVAVYTMLANGPTTISKIILCTRFKLLTVIFRKKTSAQQK